MIFQNPDDEATLRRARLVGRGQRTTVVSGSGVDLDHFRPARCLKRKSVLLIGRLVKAKGLLDYAAAARIVCASHPDIRFRIAGWIDEENPSAITRAQLDGWIADGIIDYLGPLDDVRPALADCSVFCLPSYYEGTPRTVLEALATGGRSSPPMRPAAARP